MSKRSTTDAVAATAADEEGAGGKRLKPSGGGDAVAKAGGGKKLSKTDQKWMDMYHRLVAFKEEHGHTHVSLSSDNYIPGPFEDSYLGGGSTRGRIPRNRDHHDLAKWTSRQREAKKNGKLRADREKLLTDIDFYFNSNDYVWDQHYNAIVSIMKEAGHDKVDIPSTKDELKDESKKPYEQYMAWGREQRLRYTLYQMKYKTTITERRIKMLNDINFVWYRGEKDKAWWEDKAKTKNHMWIVRHFKTYGAHKKLMDAIKRAKEEAAATGEHALVMYDSCRLVGIEPDGTFFLLHPSMVEEAEKKGNRVACF